MVLSERKEAISVPYFPPQTHATFAARLIAKDCSCTLTNGLNVTVK